jgi:ABC-type multidrug transport system ATPase subunit
MCGVSKAWNGVPVLEGLDLQVDRGHVVWVGGNNGVGKTTLLRIASGLIRADAGRIEVLGRDARSDPQRYQSLVSLVSAGDRGLYARLTVRQNLDFAAGLALLVADERRRAVARALEVFDLEELAGRRVDRMSMGQRQRLRLGLAFVREPALVLLDEPRTSLDPPGLELLDAALRELCDRGGSAIWSSPRPEDSAVEFGASYLIDHRTAVRQ